MIEKFRKIRGGISAKNWVAYIIFGAIIIVFALWGVSPDNYQGETGGVAAIVNDTSISISEYRNSLERVEQNARFQFDQFPENQRAALRKEMQKRALEELIMTEVFYQAARNRGVAASDSEVRDRILEIPFLQENGRFMKDRYRMWLQQMGLSSVDFERQVRKQIVNQRLQDLFLGSAAPTREELRRNRELANQKIKVRYVEFDKEDLASPGLVTEQEVSQFLQARKADVEKFYKDNSPEFSIPESVKARHILIKIDDKRTDSEAAALAVEVRKQLSLANFAQQATKMSDDPGSKSKGGDLGQFERGRMVPEFEKVAFALAPGQISEPVKTQFGYHLIMVEKKNLPQVKPLDSVQREITRKLIAREKESAILNGLKAKLESGRREIEKTIAAAGWKWSETGEFDLSSPSVPRLGDSPELIGAILKKGKSGGLIPEIIKIPGGRHLIADLVSWKEVRDKEADVEGLERMVAYRKSAELIETFAKDAEAKARIQRNPRVVQ